MTALQRRGIMVMVGVIGLIQTACGHYKSDFACKGYPDSSVCLSTREAYERRHEQLTNMKKNDAGEESAAGNGGSFANRVSAVAGQAEQHLGQPNITAPEVMQVWIAPWRDKNNFLHEASIVYAIVQQSDWTYGRAPKGMDRNGSAGKVFVPRMVPGLVEPPYGQRNNAPRPVLAPAPMPTPAPVVTAPPPSSLPASAQPVGTSQDPSAILRQLQQQLPSMSGPIPAPYGGPVPTDPETEQERLQERMEIQREKMGQ
ncbi:MAG: type IV conjugative transfer system lipoprotein TraV [Nitrospira sp.]|jgi:type IV conjugative transfer system lipoprotein TraV|nr:type IV conjugative transfer system lipoprotein TraV [Nitrospira sp.]